MGIVIKNLTKAFGDTPIIDKLSLTFPEQGLYRIGGPSGVGKTTLLRIIAGLDTEYIGEVSGVEKVSFAFQEYRLFPWLTALDNVVVAAFDDASSENREKAKETLMRLGFTEDEIHLRPSQLSGGMKQRVSLARAFLRSAPLLLLDEPTKELDINLVDAVREMIVEASAERLVILVTHDTYFDDIGFSGEVLL